MPFTYRKHKEGAEGNRSDFKFGTYPITIR